MKRLTFLFLFSVISIGGLLAQDGDMPSMMPPPPIENAVYDAMIGTWVGESNMMGTMLDETMVIKWDLNHQFLIMILKSTPKDNSSMGYSGMGIFGVDASGNSKMWWFDDWGVEGMMAGEGSFDGMKLSMSGENASYKDSRTIEWNNDGQMVINWKGVMKMEGEDMTMEGQTIFTKK
jgi:hypothetical protein